MSTRTTFRPQVVLSAVSMASTQTSSPTILQSLTKASYQAVWSAGATPVGTLSVQVSDDYHLNPDGTAANAGTWTTMTLTLLGVAVTSIPVSGNSGSIFIDIATSAYACRLVYTAASGSGTLTATINAKVG